MLEHSYIGYWYFVFKCISNFDQKPNKNKAQSTNHFDARKRSILFSHDRGFVSDHPILEYRFSGGHKSLKKLSLKFSNPAKTSACFKKRRGAHRPWKLWQFWHLRVLSFIVPLVISSTCADRHRTDLRSCVYYTSHYRSRGLWANNLLLRFSSWY